MTILETLQDNKESIDFIASQLNTQRHEFPSYIVLIQNLSNLTDYMNFFYTQPNKKESFQSLDNQVTKHILVDLNEFTGKMIECIVLYLSIYVKESNYDDLERFVISRQQWEKDLNDISIKEFIELFNKTLSELLIASANKFQSNISGTKTSLYVLKPIYTLNQLAKTIQSISE